MKNKKGETLLVEEVFKIILAGLCIVLLLFLAIKIYGLITEKTKIEQAKATLNIITEKIEQVKKDNIPITFIINSPKNYYIYSTSGDRCKGKYCLCFSPPYGINHPIASMIGKINEGEAICKATDDYIQVVNKNNNEKIVGIYQSTSVVIEKQNDGSFVLSFDAGSTSDFIRFFKNLFKKK